MPCAPCDPRRMLHGGRVVRVDMKQPRASDLVGINLPRIDRQACGTMPEHSPLTTRSVHHDIGRLVGTIRPLPHVPDIDAGTPQAFHLNAPALVISHASDVFRPQAQPRTCNHRRSNLPADGIELARKPNLAARRGESLHREHRVGRVQPQPDHVETSVEAASRSATARSLRQQIFLNLPHGVARQLLHGNELSRDFE